MTTNFPFPRMPETMTTTRLRLRTPVLADAPRIAMFIGDWDVVKMLAKPPHPYREADAISWIETLDRRDGAHYVLVHANGVVGVVGLQSSDKADAELGYWLAKPFWGRGLMTEAATAVMAAASTCTPYAEICSGHFADNAASQRVLVKLGFERHGDSLLQSVSRGAAVRHVDYRRRLVPLPARGESLGAAPPPQLISA
jgi:RimJ/RimL family protein N-acetyltransferase